MNDRSQPGRADTGGSQKRTAVTRLKSWEIAGKCFHTQDGRLVAVEHASDAQFQFFVWQSGLPVEEGGIAEWSWNDKCGFINYALRLGVSLPFVEQNSSPNTSDQGSVSEVLVSSESAQEAQKAIPTSQQLA